MPISRLRKRMGQSGLLVVVQLAGLAVFFVLGVYVARYHQTVVNRVVVDVKSLLVSSDEIAEELLSSSYGPALPSSSPSIRSIDTSRLPLTLSEVRLDQTGEFATGGRGSIAIVEGRLLAMDRLGRIFEYADGVLERLALGDVPSNVNLLAIENVRQGRRGSPAVTHDIAYDALTRTLFVSHQIFEADSRQQRFAVSALAIDPASLLPKGPWEVIYQSELIAFSDTDLQEGSGGAMFVANGTLYFTVGDYAEAGLLRANQLSAQDPASAFGKVIAYDIREQKSSMKALGLRNALGVVVTAQGEIITAENGPEGGDEINVIADRANYGWPYRTYGTAYGRFSWPLPVAAPTILESVEPLFAWVPSPALSSIVEVSGFDSQWDGDLLVGSLKAQTLFRLRRVQGHVLFSEPIWIGHRIRDIGQVNGRMVLMTDDPSLVFVDVDRERLSRDTKLDAATELDEALATCVMCHHFGPTNPSHLAPSLSNIFERNIASDDFARYSDALKQRGNDHWTEESLRAFLRDPSKTGSSMPNLGLSEADIYAVVRALKN